ncbi:MAG: hypothetical protein E3J87_04055 [Candidatus Cloacimonadota bacterium]|nr:MAG: hypothetical protein E3J87_04055 [Candidatus Cloacimonadota bacterium]
MKNRETGKVVEVTAQGTARVLIQRKKWCDHCPSKNACNPPEEGKMFTVEVENPIGAKEGDIVEIGIARGAVALASFWAYLVPALLFLIGIAIGFSLLSKYIEVIPKEFLGLITGIILLLASFLILRIVNNKLKKNKTFRPEIIGICSDN